MTDSVLMGDSFPCARLVRWVRCVRTVSSRGSRLLGTISRSLVAIAVALVAGCSSNTDQAVNPEVGSATKPDSEVVSSTIGPPREAGNVTNYPATSILNLVLLKARTYVDVATEVEALTAECMVARGWSYTAVDGSFTSGGEEANLSFLAVKALREVDGYGIVKLPDTDPVNPNRLYASQLSEAQALAYGRDLGSGTTEGGVVVGPPGCQEQAEAEVYAELPAYQPQYANLTSQSDDELKADERFTAAKEAWKICMQAFGYNFETSNLAKSSIQATVSLLSNEQIQAQYPELKRNELAVAKADTTCYETTILPVHPQVEAEILDRFVNDGLLSTDLWPLDK